MRTAAILILSLLLFSSCAAGVPKEEAAVAYYNLGNAYVELKNYKEAVKAFEKAIGLNPSLVKATYNLAKIYIEGGEPRKSIEILENLLKTDRENSIVLETLAYAHYKMGNPEEALKIYEAILERDSYNSSALHNSALLLIARDEKERAREYLERLYESDQSDMIIRGMGIIAGRLGETEKAIDLLTVYLQKDASDTEVLELLGDLYSREELYWEALQRYNETIAVKEKSPLVHFKKARILLFFIEDKEEGLKSLDAALSHGFKDKDEVLLLLEEADKSLAEELEKIFVGKNIIKPGERLGDEEEPEETPEKEPEETGTPSESEESGQERESI